MSLSPKVLSAIQHASQAVHQAQVELASAASDQTQRLNAALVAHDFDSDVDGQFQDLKSSVSLAREMTEINQRLAAMCARAGGATRETTQAATAKPARRRAEHSGGGSRDEARRAMNAAQRKLRGNNAKVWAFLKDVVQAHAFTGVPQARIAEGAQIPLGSVAYSVSRLLSLQLIEEGSIRGTYRLR